MYANALAKLAWPSGLPKSTSLLQKLNTACPKGEGLKLIEKEGTADNFTK